MHDPHGLGCREYWNRKEALVYSIMGKMFILEMGRFSDMKAKTQERHSKYGYELKRLMNNRGILETLVFQGEGNEKYQIIRRSDNLVYDSLGSTVVSSSSKKYPNPILDHRTNRVTA